MRTVLIGYSILLMVVSCHEAWAGQNVSGSEKMWQEELALRYDLPGWPGKGSPIKAGFKPENFSFKGLPLVLDHVQWIEQEGEIVPKRQYTTPDHRLTLEIAVTRSCTGAHQFLFHHLTRPRSMKPLEPPGLPYGNIRENEIGHVCFVLPLNQGKKGFRSIEFVRNNLVFLLSAVGEVAQGLKDFALVLDQAVLNAPHYPTWESSNQWPLIEEFALPSPQIKKGSLVPLALVLNDRSNGPLLKHWETPSGGILQDGKEVLYYAEGSGMETLTLWVSDSRGLATHAQIQFEVVP